MSVDNSDVESEVKKVVNYLVHCASRPFQKKYGCKKCLYSTDRHYLLKRHQLLHLKLRDKLELKKLQCPRDCGYFTERREHIKRHLHRCKGEKVVFVTWPSMCSICRYQFHDYLKVRKHETESHGINKENAKYHCDQCTFKANNNTDVTRHEKACHVKGDDILCEYCGVSTASPNKWMEHISKHHSY